MFAKICIFATENQLFKKEESRPTWACGLKLSLDVVEAVVEQSRPTWACGLKLDFALLGHSDESHAPRGRVD